MTEAQPAASKTIRQIIYGFAAILILMVLTMAGDILHMQKMRLELQVMGIDLPHRLILAQQLRTIVRERMVAMSTMLLETDPFKRDQIFLRFNHWAGKFILARDELESSAVGTEEQALLEELRQLTLLATPLNDEVVALLRSGHEEPARLLLLGQALPAQNSVLAQADRLLEHYRQASAATVGAQLYEYQHTHRYMLAFAAIAILLAIGIALLVIHRIRQQQGSLLDEIDERRHAEAKLRQLHAALEGEVEKRTHQLNDMVQRLGDAQRIGHMGHWDWDIARQRLCWSDEVSRIFGLQPQEFAATYEAFLACIHPADRDSVTQAVTGALQDNIPYSIEHRIVRPDGTERVVHEQAEVTRDTDGTPIRMLGAVQDVTEQRRNEAQLRLAASVFGHAAEAILITDQAGHIVDANQAYLEVSGYNREEIIGQIPELMQPENITNAESIAMWRELEEDGTWQGETSGRRKNGEVYPQWLTISEVHDAAGRLANYVIIFRDITDIKRNEQRLWHIAHHDPLCDIPNRNLMAMYLKQAIARARRDGHGLALLLIDLDEFKAVNDTLGHAIGDQLLIHVANTLKECIRESDVMSRLAGDEFTILLDRLQTADDAAGVANKILQKLEQPLRLDGHEIIISASIGIALFPQHADEGEALLKCADSAMYLAKGAGRNTCRFFSDRMSPV